MSLNGNSLLCERIAGSKLYTEVLPWVFCCQDIPLFGHCNMGIDFCNVDGAVSQHFLNIADINISFQQTGGKGVPEHMRSDMQVYCCKRGILGDDAAYGLIRQGVAILIREEMTTLFDFCLKIIFVSDQNIYHGVISNLYFSFFASFSVNQDGPVVQTDIIRF